MRLATINQYSCCKDAYDKGISMKSKLLRLLCCIALYTTCTRPADGLSTLLRLKTETAEQLLKNKKTWLALENEIDYVIAAGKTFEEQDHDNSVPAEIWDYLRKKLEELVFERSIILPEITWSTKYLAVTQLMIDDHVSFNKAYPRSTPSPNAPVSLTTNVSSSATNNTLTESTDHAQTKAFQAPLSDSAALTIFCAILVATVGFSYFLS